MIINVRLNCAQIEHLGLPSTIWWHKRAWRWSSSRTASQPWRKPTRSASLPRGIRGGTGTAGMVRFWKPPNVEAFHQSWTTSFALDFWRLGSLGCRELSTNTDSDYRTSYFANRKTYLFSWTQFGRKNMLRCTRVGKVHFMLFPSQIGAPVFLQLSPIFLRCIGYIELGNKLASKEGSPLTKWKK